MAGTVRRSGLALALPALVGASTFLHWLAGRRLHGLWIMPDEAIYAARAESLWHHGPAPLLRGGGAGYGLLFPLVAGLPLSLGSSVAGYDGLKLLQALVMSLSAVPVFFYGRRLMPNAYALLAATLTVSSPLLLYSGLVMTEVLFYPVSALALFAVARAVETSTRRDQVVALILIGAATATRVQGVIFLGVFAGAVVIDALLGHQASRLRVFWPVWFLVAATGIAVAFDPGLLGAYSVTLHGGYPVGQSLRLTYYHLAYVVLMVAVLPAAAAAVLFADAVRGRLRDPGARALVAVTMAALALVVTQVGVFAARYAPHLLGRNLAPLPPLFFVLFALWLAQLSAQRLVARATTIVILLSILVFAPWNDLIVDNAVPDTLGVSLVHELSWGSPANSVAVGAAVLLVAFVAVPPRLSLTLAALVLTVLCTSSVYASNLISGRVRSDQVALVGNPPDWIDRTTKQPVSYVFGGGAWNVVWQARFWNRRIADVLSLSPAFVPGPMPQTRARAAKNGRLPIRERLVVASAHFAFVGTPIAHQSLGPDSFGLTLWRLDGPPSLSVVTNEVKPNGDMYGEGRVTVYDCQGGRLTLTLLPKTTDVLRIDLNGRRVLTRKIGGALSWHGTIDVPPASSAQVCEFTIRGGPLLGSTVIAFERPG